MIEMSIKCSFTVKKRLKVSRRMILLYNFSIHALSMKPHPNPSPKGEGRAL